jgi:hypothetical protein
MQVLAVRSLHDCVMKKIALSYGLYGVRGIAVQDLRHESPKHPAVPDCAILIEN